MKSQKRCNLIHRSIYGKLSDQHKKLLESPPKEEYFGEFDRLGITYVQSLVQNSPYGFKPGNTHPKNIELAILWLKKERFKKAVINTIGTISAVGAFVFSILNYMN